MSKDTPSEEDNELKFCCTHCQQSISTSIDTAGMEAQCPACGGAIVVPSSDQSQQGRISSVETSEPQNKPTSRRNRKPFPISWTSPRAIVISLTVIVVACAAFYFLIFDRGGNKNGDALPEEHALSKKTSVFLNRTSNKSEILGLQGGMGKSEVIMTLGVKSLKPAIHHGTHCKQPEPWNSPFPGFEAFQYKPSKSFPIDHVSKIRLVFLNDRLQSVCYVFKNNPCRIMLGSNASPWIEDDKTHFSRSYRDPEFRGYFRDDLIKDISNAIKGSFDIIDQSLYPDYTTGKYIPADGKYSVQRSYTHVDHDYYYDSISPIFYAASSDIFVRFGHALMDQNRILDDLKIELRRPNRVRADRNTNEYFFLSFSFRNTYAESLAAGENYRIQAKKLEAERVEQNRRQAIQKEEEKKIEEERRIKKIREGL